MTSSDHGVMSEEKMAAVTVEMFALFKLLLERVMSVLLVLKAGGGLAADVGIKHTLVKECQEEACIPAAIAEMARPVSAVR